MPRKGPTDVKLREFALALVDQSDESIPSVAERVFGWGPQYAKQKCWETRKHEVVQEEMARIKGERESNDPASKDDKLLKNKILMDEAYNNRDVENYIKLARIDNDMQGHTRTAETEDKKVEGGLSLMGELVAQLREQNKNKIKAVSEEIIELK